MRRPIVFVLLAGVAAMVAAIVVYSALKKREAQVADAMVKSVNVLVAAHDLPIGSKLDANSVKLVRWSKDALPPGAFSEASPVLNQYTKTGFVQNEPIVADRLFGGDKNAGVLPLLIPNGMRAVSVPVDEVSDIAGFVLPHSRVDIVVSVANNQGQNSAQYSKIVLQNVEVLAVAQEIENTNADKPQVVRVVTLLVTPDEAERVVLASHEGQLRLAMRNYEDKKIVSTSGVDVAELLRAAGGVSLQTQQAAAAPIRNYAPRPKPVEVEVLRNGKSVENVSFVHGHGGSSSSTSTPETSAADNPNKVAGAGSEAGPTQGNRTKAGVTAMADNTITTATGTKGAAPLVSSVTPTGSAIGASDQNSPHSRTIDIP